MKCRLHILENICINCKKLYNKSKASKTKMQKEYNHKLINLCSVLCLTKPLSVNGLYYNTA